MDETPQIDDELVTKLAATDVVSSSSKGRLADRVAAIIAASALGLSLLLSALFFAGFVANDYHIFAITSALGLSLFLGSFAIIPMAIVIILALKAYRQGGNSGLYLWALCLILPWLILSIICLIYTPLPVWMSFCAILFAATLTFWAILSLILEIKHQKSPRQDMPAAH